MKKFALAMAVVICAPLLSFTVLGPSRQLVDLEIFTEKRKVYYRGTWMKGKDAQKIKKYDDADALKAGLEEENKSGYAMRDIAIEKGEDEHKFYAVFDKTPEESKMILVYSWDEFKTELEKETENGFSLVDFDHYSYMGMQTYIGVLRKNNMKTEFYIDKTWSKMSDEIESNGKKKQMLLDLDRAVINGDDHYIAFFTETDKPQEYKCFKLTNSDAYDRQVNSKAKKGYIALESDGFEQGNAVAHLVVFVRQPQPYALETTETWEAFEEKFNGYNK